MRPVKLRHALATTALFLVPTISCGQSLDVHPVTDGVWAIVGEHAQRSPENLGNNATFGLLVTDAGALLVDPGGSLQGAIALHEAVRSVTDAPVVFVVNTGGQDHRWLGNDYWQAQGATVIASQAAVEDQRVRGSMQMSVLSQLLGDALAGTEPAYADTTFDESYEMELGGLAIEIVHPGPAHTPGDSYVWIPALSTIFTGDIVYTERLLAVGDMSSMSGWPVAFEAVEATGAVHVVPGHGRPTTMERAKADTYDYLMNLRDRIGALIDEGGDILEAPQVDQGAFSYLEQFDMLAGRNAQAAYQQMEWE